MKNHFLFGFLILLSFCSRAQKDNYDKVKSSSIDLSPDNSSILVSYYIKNSASIYEFDLNGEIKSKLTSASEDEWHLSPRYSPKGDKILFLSFSEKNNKESKLCLMNRDGSNLKILSKNLSITEAIFHADGLRIFFCASAYVGHYSPIGVNQPHEISVYTINLDGSELKQLANYHNYSLYGLNFLTDSILLYKVIDKDRDGFYTQQLFKPWKSEQIVVTDNPRPETKGWFYNNPAISNNKGKLAFTASYELYIMDLNTKELEKMYKPEPIGSNIFSIHFFQNDEKIIFTEDNYEDHDISTGKDYDILVMDLTDKTIRQIELKIK